MRKGEFLMIMITNSYLCAGNILNSAVQGGREQRRAENRQGEKKRRTER